jgi:hypothetical protein
MTTSYWRRNGLLPLAAIVVAGVLAAPPAVVRGRGQEATASPAAVSDQDFWRVVTDLSEAGGAFSPQLMSNEDSAQFVLPALAARERSGGVYLGVGSEQNFTYFAALRPRLAFIIDIRRDNLLEHLMYKALFDRAADRADFLARLFARRRPSGLSADSDVAALFAAFATVPADDGDLERNTSEVIDTLAITHGFPLSADDRRSIGSMMRTFRTAGPDSLKGWGDLTNLTYAQLMSATDGTGRQQSFLASEGRYQAVRALERSNLVIPIVGDFAVDKALTGIGHYLADHGDVVDVFYVSNVERYLFEQGPHGQRFYTNLRSLPRSPSSIFIRAVTRDISQRLAIPLPAAQTKWWTFVSPIDQCLQGIADGRIRTYRDLFTFAG